MGEDIVVCVDCGVGGPGGVDCVCWAEVEVLSWDGRVYEIGRYL